MHWSSLAMISIYLILEYIDQTSHIHRICCSRGLSKLNVNIHTALSYLQENNLINNTYKIDKYLTCLSWEPDLWEKGVGWVGGEWGLDHPVFLLLITHRAYDYMQVPADSESTDSARMWTFFHYGFSNLIPEWNWKKEITCTLKIAHFIYYLFINC